MGQLRVSGVADPRDSCLPLCGLVPAEASKGLTNVSPCFWPLVLGTNFGSYSQPKHVFLVSHLGDVACTNVLRASAPCSTQPEQRTITEVCSAQPAPLFLVLGVEIFAWCNGVFVVTEFQPALMIAHLPPFYAVKKLYLPHAFFLWAQNGLCQH